MNLTLKQVVLNTGIKSLLLIFSMLLFAGCSSTPTTKSGEASVRYARYVKVAIFDTTPRPPTDKLTTLREAPTQKYQTIAMLTIDGEAKAEGALINALAWKARQLGANAMIIQTPLHPHRDQWIFRADAIVMDSEK